MADTFRIYKKDGTKVSEGSSPVAIDGMTVGQKAGDGDYYAVQVISSTEESAKAPIPGFTAMGVPGAPSIKLTAKDAAIDYVITAPEDDGAPSSGSSDITSYTVTYTPAGGQAVTVAVPDPTKLSGTVDKLTNATEYTFTVTATNPAGQGPASTAVKATPKAAA
jgi:hypothetical protein